MEQWGVKIKGGRVVEIVLATGLYTTDSIAFLKKPKYIKNTQIEGS